jgi:hypothetical protein
MCGGVVAARLDGEQAADFAGALEEKEKFRG